MTLPLVAITGASSGIGEATALAFSKAGYPLLLMARRIDRMEALDLPNALCRQVDVRDRAAVMNGVHAVMTGMMERRHGTIVNMSSIAGRKVYPDHTVYCGTKFFVHAVSESLRGQLAPYDVRVIVISPGIVETEVLQHVKDEGTLSRYRANKENIGGGIAAEHVAEMILFAYQMPQSVLIQEMCVTPTRQEY